MFAGGEYAVAESERQSDERGSRPQRVESAFEREEEFLHDLGVTYVTCSGLIMTGNAALSKSENLQLSKEEITAILKEAVSYAYSNDMEISFTSPGWIDEEFFEENGLNMPTCGACLSNMAITPGGNAVPCQSWLTDGNLGNFLDLDWEKIWYSGKCQNRRYYSGMMTGLCPLAESRANESKEERKEGDTDEK